MIRKAAVTLCAIVALAMPVTVEGIPFDLYIMSSCRREVQNYRTIKVRKGENLWRISKLEYGTPMAYGALAIINRIKNPNRIFPGQRLIIPQEGTRMEDGYGPFCSP